MNIIKYINVPVFILSLLFGLFAVYIFGEDKKKILVYPTHENAHVLQYKDKAGNCFSIKENNILCPKDDEISEIPVQA